jgi:hypothetical protein
MCVSIPGNEGEKKALVRLGDDGYTDTFKARGVFNAWYTDGEDTHGVLIPGLRTHWELTKHVHYCRRGICNVYV